MKLIHSIPAHALGNQVPVDVYLDEDRGLVWMAVHPVVPFLPGASVSTYTWGTVASVQAAVAAMPESAEKSALADALTNPPDLGGDPQILDRLDAIPGF